MLRRTAVWIVMLLTGVIGSPIYASAHSSTSSVILAAPPSSAAAPMIPVAAGARPRDPSGEMGLTALILAGIIVSVLYASRRRRRVRIRILGLSLLLLVAGFESAVHSVHHLGDAAAAERCLVAATGQHAAVVSPDGPLITDPLLRAGDVAPPARPSRAHAVWLALDAGRGPPA
jgi:hypothetical protein